MTTDAESRHDLSIALDRWHRNSCHPDATTGDLSVGVDAVLAAIRASGRLAPEVADVANVKKRAMKAMDDAWLDAPSNYIRDCWGRIFDAAAPLIAAAVEAKALALVGQCASQVIDARGPPVDHDYRDRHMIEGVELLQEAIESAIRTGSAS